MLNRSQFQNFVALCKEKANKINQQNGIVERSIKEEHANLWLDSILSRLMLAAGIEGKTQLKIPLSGEGSDYFRVIKGANDTLDGIFSMPEEKGEVEPLSSWEQAEVLMYVFTPQNVEKAVELLRKKGFGSHTEKSLFRSWFTIEIS